MLSRIRSLLHLAPAREINFVPLCHVPPEEAKAWHRCQPLTLSDEAYERLHEFLQANLHGRWSLMPQDRNQLERYDLLLDIKTEAGLIDLFRITIGMGQDGADDTDSMIS
jgi:hypothetical protein